MTEELSVILKLLSVALLVVANGFFVAAEFALVSVRRTRIEQLVKEEVSSARVVSSAIHDLDRYIAGTQVGITLASIGLGWAGEPAIARLIEPLLQYLPFHVGAKTLHAFSFAVAYATVTFLHVVFGELIPKSVALQKPEVTALFVARPLRLVVRLLHPVIWALNGTGNYLLRRMGLEPAAGHHSVHTVEELEILVRQSHAAGVLDEFERQMLQHTFNFSELTAGDVMIPRPDMVALDVNQPTGPLLDRVAETIHGRIPVFEHSIDHIIGILHLPDLFKQLHRAPQELDVRGLLRSPLVVPESVHLDALIEQFRTSQQQIAIVIDEHGGTAGLVTLEDVVEEVFGEMNDALEAEQPQIQAQPDGRLLVRGDVRLDELNDETGWRLEDPDSDTIAGFVMKQLGRTARVGDRVPTEFGVIQVENMARHRITQVAVTTSPKDDGDAGPPSDAGPGPGRNAPAGNGDRPNPRQNVPR